MTPEEQLISLAAADKEPFLTVSELVQCLQDSAVPDQNGTPPDDPHWEPAYDMNRAAAKAWRLKAGRVAADYTVTIEGREINRGEMVANFIQMANMYAKLAQPRYLAAPDDRESWRV